MALPLAIILAITGYLAVPLTVAQPVTYAGTRVRYDNHRVYELHPRTEAQLATIKALDGARDSYIFLDPLYTVDTKIGVIVAPHRVPRFLRILEESAVAYELLDDNAQDTLDAEESVADSNRRSGDYSWTQYHELNDTYAWLHSLATIYPDLITVFVAGESYEGRELLGVKLSFGDVGAGDSKKGIFIEGGMHAREWIGPATVTYILNQLLTNTDKEVRMIAESFDWYILPHANPDGYVYTHTTDRMWRKTRTAYKNGCFGADLNRNWGFHWNEVGTDDDPCSELYSGPVAFSEVESRSLAKYVSTLKNELLLYIAFHSYAQRLLFPYGHTSELPPNYKDLKRVSDVAVKAVKQRYGTKYKSGTMYKTLYPAAGSSVDWAYGELGIPYAYTYELRPSVTGSAAFNLPAEQIIPNCEEIMDSLMAMIKAVGIRKFL